MTPAARTSPRPIQTGDSPPTSPARCVRIAAVIPTYNRAGLIERAVESVLAQSDPADEIIVVDDGSTDGTAERLERFGEAVTVLRRRNSGAAAARNAGVRHACSPWVAFLDSDDIWQPAHLRQMRAAIGVTGGRAALYFADTLRPYSGGKVGSYWARCGFRVEGALALFEPSSAWIEQPRMPMMLQSSVVSRREFLELGGLWEQLGPREDTHFFFRVALERPICAVAGYGAEMTADADDSGRLTAVCRNHSLIGHRQLVWMYADLLRRWPRLGQDRKRALRRRLAAARFGLGRAALRRHCWFEAVWNLSGAVLADPSRLGKLRRRSGAAASGGS